MAELDPNIIIDISKTISAIDERTRALQNADIAAQKAADHRHANVMQAISTFVPRREIETMNDATRGYAEQLAKESREHCDTNRELVIARVSVIEEAVKEITSAAKSVNRWFLGVVGTAAVTALGYLTTHFMHIKLFWQN